MFVARYFEQKRAEKAAKELDLDVVPSERVGSKLNKWLLTRPTREEVIERGILIDREQRNAVAQSLEIFFGRQLATDRESREEGRRYNATADLPSSSAPPLEEGNTQLPLPSTAVPPFPYSSRLKEFLESSKLIDLPSLTKAKKKLREANERLQQTQTDLDANQASFPRQAKRANIEILSLFQSVAHHEASLRSIEDRLHGSELLSAEERMKELTALLQKMQKLIGEKRYLLRVQKMYMQSAGVQAKMFRDPSGALEDLDAFFCSLKSLEGGACSRLAGERLLFVCNYLRPFFVDGLHQCLKSMGWGMLTEVSKSCGVRAELEEREELPETILQLEDRTVFFAGALDLLEECYRGGLQMTCAEGRRGGENEVANRKESASAADAGKRDCRFEREKEGGGSKFSWIESTLCARIIETFRFQMLRAESSACRPDKPEFAFKYMEELHKQHATRLSFLAPLSEVEGEEEERRGGIEGAENEKFLKDLNICERRGLEVFRRAKSTDACIAGPLCLELRFFLRGLFRTLVDERSARLWIERANGNEKEKEDSDSHHAKKGGGMEMMQNQLLPESCREGGGGALSLSERHRLVLHLIQVVVEAKAYWVEADPASAAEITADFDENTRLWGGVEEERGGQRETSSAAEGGQSEGVKKKTSKGGTTEGKKEKEGEPVDGWDVDLDDLEIEEEEEEEEEEGGGGGGEGKREEDKEGGGETRNENDVAEEEKSAPVGLLDLFVSLDLLMVHRSLNASSKPASSFWMPLSVGVEGGGPFVGRLGRQVIELLTVATARTSLLTSDGAIDLYCQTVLLFILRKAAAALKEKWNALTDPGGKADREGAALAVETARVLSDYLVAELNCAPWLTEEIGTFVDIGRKMVQKLQEIVSKKFKDKSTMMTARQNVFTEGIQTVRGFFTLLSAEVFQALLEGVATCAEEAVMDVIMNRIFVFAVESEKATFVSNCRMLVGEMRQLMEEFGEWKAGFDGVGEGEAERDGKTSPSVSRGSLSPTGRISASLPLLPSDGRVVEERGRTTGTPLSLNKGRDGTDADAAGNGSASPSTDLRGKGAKSLPLLAKTEEVVALLTSPRESLEGPLKSLREARRLREKQREAQASSLLRLPSSLTGTLIPNPASLLGIAGQLARTGAQTIQEVGCLTQLSLASASSSSAPSASDAVKLAGLPLRLLLQSAGEEGEREKNQASKERKGKGGEGKVKGLLPEVKEVGEGGRVDREAQELKGGPFGEEIVRRESEALAALSMSALSGPEVLEVLEKRADFHLRVPAPARD